MASELHDTIAAAIVTAHALWTTVVAIAYAAGASEALAPEALAAGAAAGGVAGAAAAGAGGSGDKGFRFSTGDGIVYEQPSSDTPTGRVPRGSRMPYDGVVRDASGNPTHYHVRRPDGRTGYMPADQTSDRRPPSAPRGPPRSPSVLIESGPKPDTHASAARL